MGSLCQRRVRVIKYAMLKPAIINLVPVLLAVCQAHPIPYLMINGSRLSNHSYIALSGIRAEGTGFGLECHLITCWGAEGGNTTGAWHFPDGTRMSDYSSNANESKKVVMYQNHYDGKVGVSGIYRCEMLTAFGGNESVYAGIYANDKGWCHSFLWHCMHYNFVQLSRQCDND